MDHQITFQDIRGHFLVAEAITIDPVLQKYLIKKGKRWKKASKF